MPFYLKKKKLWIFVACVCLFEVFILWTTMRRHACLKPEQQQKILSTISFRLSREWNDRRLQLIISLRCSSHFQNVFLFTLESAKTHLHARFKAGTWIQNTLASCSRDETYVYWMWIDWIAFKVIWLFWWGRVSKRDFQPSASFLPATSQKKNLKSINKLRFQLKT